MPRAVVCGAVDCVFVKGIEVLGHHGVTEEERRLGHLLRVDVRLYLDTSAAAEEDDVELTADYEEATRLIAQEAGGTPVKLLETLGERIAARLFERFACVERLELTLGKLAPPIGRPSEWAGVELVRSRPK